MAVQLSVSNAQAVSLIDNVVGFRAVFYTQSGNNLQKVYFDKDPEGLVVSFTGNVAVIQLKNRYPTALEVTAILPV